jgi:hypothetical protein
MSRMTKMDGERILLDREGSQRSVETRFFLMERRGVCWVLGTGFGRRAKG